MEVLTNILALLKKQNKKQIELATRLGLSTNVFTEWNAGRNTSYKKYLPEIAEFFGVSMEYLLGKETYKNTEALEYTYALYNEITHDLSNEKIEELKKFAEFLRHS